GQRARAGGDRRALRADAVARGGVPALRARAHPGSHLRARMQTWRRPPRAARPARRERALAGLALSLAFVPACSSPAGSAVDAGEELPGGSTTNRLLFGSNAFLPAADNISRDNQRLFATGNAFF